MGIANKKCITCGGGAVQVKHAPEVEGESAYLRYRCWACDYKWEEPPLYAKKKTGERYDWMESEPVAVNARWALRREVAHLEYLLECYKSKSTSQCDWEHVHACFSRSVQRLKPLIIREKEKDSGIPCDVRDIPGATTFPYDLKYLEVYLGAHLGLYNLRLITLIGYTDPGIHSGKGTITMNLGDAALVVIRALGKEVAG